MAGQAGQIALMHRVLVEEKGWLDEQRFLHALNFCMLLPGPEAMQLATYSGWLLRGVAGGVLAGLLFVLPGLAVLLTLSAIYAAYGDVPLVAGMLFGLKAAVLAIIVQALLRVARRALKGRAALAVAGAAFLMLAMSRTAVSAGHPACRPCRAVAPHGVCRWDRRVGRMPPCLQIPCSTSR